MVDCDRPSVLRRFDSMHITRYKTIWGFNPLQLNKAAILAFSRYECKHSASGVFYLYFCKSDLASVSYIAFINLLFLTLERQKMCLGDEQGQIL